MKNKNGLESTVFNAIKHGAAAIAVAGATYLGAYLITPDYAYANEKPAKQENVADMNSNKFDLVPKDKKKEYCDVKEQKKPEAKKDSPKPKGKKKAPEPKDDCYNLILKEAGGKELPLENKYGEEGKCSYRSAQIEAGKEYVLSLNDANEFFNDMPVAEPYKNIETSRTFYDSNGRARTIAFKVKDNISLIANLTNKNGAVEIDDELELFVRKPEAKKEEPKKEDFTPVPAPKPVEEPKSTPVAEEESDLDADVAAQVDISYVQNTQDLSGSQINYSGLRTGLVVVPSLRLSENASLGVYGKYAHTNFPSLEVNGASSEGSKALEHEFGGGLLLNIKGNKDKTSRAGDLKVVIGGGYLGIIHQMEYMGYSFEQNQNGGDFMVAVNAPRLIYHPDGADTNENVNGIGLEGSANGRVLRTRQSVADPEGRYDRGTRFDIKGNLALNATTNKIKAKLGWGGTSIESLLPDAGRRNGSHLLVGIGSPDSDEGFRWDIEGTVPYGVDNDEFGAEACFNYNNMRFCADGRRYSMPTGTGNGDSAENQAIYTGVKASYSTDFDMALVKGLNRIFGGN